MAQYKDESPFETIQAKTVEGGLTAIFVRHSPDFIRDLAERCNPRNDFRHLPNQGGPVLIKKSVEKIEDVGGAADGARTAVTSCFHHESGRGEKVIARLAESVEDLEKAFEKANVSMPPVCRSLGKKLRDLKASLLSRQPV